MIMERAAISKMALALTLLISILPLLLSYFIQNNSKFEELSRLKSYVRDDLPLHIPVHIRYGDEGFNFPDLAAAIQIQLNIESFKLYGERWNIEIYDELEESKGPNSKIGDTTSNKERITPQFLLKMYYGSENYLLVDPKGMEAHLYFDVTAVHSNDLPFYVTQTILYHLVNQEINALKYGIMKNTLTNVQILLIREEDSLKQDSYYKFILEQSQLHSEQHENLNIQVSEIFNSSIFPSNNNTVYVFEGEHKKYIMGMDDDLPVVYLGSNLSSINSTNRILLWNEMNDKIYGITEKNLNIAESIGLTKNNTLELLADMIGNFHQNCDEKGVIDRLKQRVLYSDIYNRIYKLVERVKSTRTSSWDHLLQQAQELNDQILRL